MMTNHRLYKCETCGHDTRESTGALQSELDKARQQIASMESQRNAAMETEKADALKALYALAGSHIATPEEGYGSNTSWAISDLCRAVKELNTQLVESRERERKLVEALKRVRKTDYVSNHLSCNCYICVAIGPAQASAEGKETV